MTNEDFPFVQKRFIEEYRAWTAVEQISSSKLLTEMPRLKLEAKPILQVGPEVPATGAKPAAETIPFKAKPIPVPLTDAQLRDRREMLKQQAASLAKTRIHGNLYGDSSRCSSPSRLSP